MVMHKKKKAVSEMVSYAILIVITLSAAVGVYSWLKWQVPNCGDDGDCLIAKDCNEDTYLRLDDYQCIGNLIILNLSNNGRFNVSGIMFVVAEDGSKIPDIYLNKDGGKGTRPGEYIFDNPVGPGQQVSINFSSLSSKNLYLEKIEKMQMQIFVYENSKRVLCKNVIINEKLQNCFFS